MMEVARLLVCVLALVVLFNLSFPEQKARPDGPMLKAQRIRQRLKSLKRQQYDRWAWRFGELNNQRP